jgi:hypothetical protein
MADLFNEQGSTFVEHEGVNERLRRPTECGFQHPRPLAQEIPTI